MNTMDTTDFDAIVVGSGATGGWAAKELTEAGLKVLVLERGRTLEHGRDYVTEHVPPWELPFRDRPLRELYRRDYPVQSTTHVFNETTRHFFVNDRESPYVQAPGQAFNWIRAEVVGGKSLLWGRHVYRWSDLDFEANRRDGHGADWPIRYADLQPWYAHVERFIGVSGQAEGLPHLPDGEFLPPMAMNAVEEDFKQRIEAAPGQRRVTIGRVANLTQPHRGRAACHLCGACERGCSAGAYFSSQSSTLPAAMATGRLWLLADKLVEGLDYDPVRKRIAGVRVLDTKTRERKRYTAKLVFLCASTAATVQVLLNSRSEHFPTGLADGSRTLGRYVMDHFMGMTLAGVPGFEDRYPQDGRPSGCYMPRFRNLAGRDRGVDFDRGYGYQLFASRAGWQSQGVELPGFGADFKHRLQRPGGWTLSLVHFGECLPHRENRIVLDLQQVDRFGMPQARFEVSFRDNEARAHADASAQAVAMLKAVGATWVLPPSDPYPPGSAIHEMGGARMGHDPRDSVLNAHNQAHDVANLFVTDGACMVSSSCVNPTLTYMALTARAANHAVAQLKSGAI